MSTQQAIHYVPNGEILGIKQIETKTHIKATRLHLSRCQCGVSLPVV